MRTQPLPFFLLSFLFSQLSFSQGWQFVGPDSVNWQNVRHVSAKYSSPSAYRLTASSTNKGIATLSLAGRWSYPLRNWYDSFFETGEVYDYYEFSRWDDTVGFIGSARLYTEPAYYIQRSYVAGTTSQWTLSGCWATPLSVLYPPNSDSTILASVCGLHKSTNRGRTWDTLGGISYSHSYKKLLAFDESSDQRVYMSDVKRYGSPLSLFVSSNQGRTWDSLFSVAVNPRPPSYAPYIVYAMGDTILVGVSTSLFDTLGIAGIFRSSNRGTSWTHVVARNRVSGFVRSEISSATLFAASEEGILKSTDFGATWTQYNNALPTRRLTSLIISPYSDTMFVSTETHGVLKVWNYLTDVAENKSLPDKFELMQNYPNPFNPTTTIKFQIPTSSFVTLRVFDLLGREVATLVDEELKPGSHERTFKGSGLASGVYLYRLHAGSFVQTKKLLLLR